MRWLPFGAMLTLVTVLLLIPKPGTLAPGVDVPDALLHGLAYAALALAAAVARPRPAPLGAFLVAHGALTECLQAFVPGRTPNWGDWMADVAGTLLTLGVVHAARRRRRSR